MNSKMIFNKSYTGYSLINTFFKEENSKIFISIYLFWKNITLKPSNLK